MDVRERWHSTAQAGVAAQARHTCETVMAWGSAACEEVRQRRESDAADRRLAWSAPQLPHAPAGLSALPTAMFATCKAQGSGSESSGSVGANRRHVHPIRWPAKQAPACKLSLQLRALAGYHAAATNP